MADRHPADHRNGSMKVDVLELATEGNLYPEGYLAANPDLKKVFGSDTSAGQTHFKQCGCREGRRQFSRDFLLNRKEFCRRKFDVFKHTLLDPSIASFPAFIGQSFARIADYEAEPANATPGFFDSELADNPHKLYADVGAGLRDAIYLNCVYTEIYPSLTADIITEPTCTLPFASQSLDGIGCFAVLEHVTMPWRLADEFARVIKPGGKVFIDWPFLVPVHGYPSHYYNATPEGLRQMFSDRFEITKLYTGHWQGPDYTINWLLNNLLRSLKNEKIRDQLADMTVRSLADMTPQSDRWRMIIDSMDAAAVAELSCGNTLIAHRKPDRGVVRRLLDRSGLGLKRRLRRLRSQLARVYEVNAGKP